ncbi:hypothetical protein K2173_005485 [Erythroxylum novogranatense]|uniref:Transmembrane protein n=1 Tax=Erythroxylum novogranatense TaxID=1862640 RepID=A0AAV8SKS3_9ROSI|nr:hypothetical protein K2173_005485 [Erythroxylum novogranatense]
MNMWKQMANRLRGNTTFSTATSPYAPAGDYGHRVQRNGFKIAEKGDLVPVYVALGMILVSTTLGLYTAKHQLLYSPTVRVKKKLRETIPEVEYPDKVVDESSKFMEKSLLRKVAHVKKFESGLQEIPDAIRKDVFAHPPRTETLKSVPQKP